VICNNFRNHAGVCQIATGRTEWERCRPCGQWTFSSTPPPTDRPVTIVSVVDEDTRECLGGFVERSITGNVLIDQPAARLPAVLRRRPELACTAMANWAGERIGFAFNPPGQPWRNGYIETFNGRLRYECLNINLF
jgi:hypothetical protein